MFSLSRRLFTLGSFNVRGLTSGTKRNSLRLDLSSYNVDVCTLQETKISAGLDEHFGGYRIICMPSSSYHYGLGFAVSTRVSSSIYRYWSVSDRVAVLTLSLGQNSRMAVINAYAPTAARCASSIDESDQFYSALSTAFEAVRGETLLYLAGDFNSKVGTRRNNEICVGAHGRGRRNINGQALVDYCDMNGLFIANTAFQHSARHKTTWVGARRDYTTGRTLPVYNQIDFVICRQNQKRILTDSRSYGGCETPSDHRLVVAKLQLNRSYGIFGSHRKYQSKTTNSPPLDIGRLAADPNGRVRRSALGSYTICNQGSSR